jgi:hypothetical protein
MLSNARVLKINFSRRIVTAYNRGIECFAHE